MSIRAFATYVGVRHPSVLEAIQTGRLIDSGGGIDPEHPLSVAYAERAALRVRAKGWQPTPWERRVSPRTQPAHMQDAPDGPPPPSPATQVTDRARSSGPNFPGRSPVSRENDRVGLATESRARDIKTNREAISLQKEKIGYLTMIGKLVRGDDYDRSIGRIAAVFENQVRPFADRHADQLEAMAKAGAGRAEFFDYLDAELDKVMKAVEATCDREVQDRAAKVGAAAEERGARPVQATEREEPN